MTKSASQEIEILELQATVESQEDLIMRITEDLRNVQKTRDFTAEVEILGREQKCMELQEQVDGKSMTIQHLKDELGSSQKVIDEVYRKYDGLRVSRDQKDQSIRRLQQELHTCHDMLEQAQKEKLVLADKMRAIENEKTDMEFDYQWLCDKIKSYEDGDSSTLVAKQQ